MSRKYPNRFLLHRCDCNNHYHLILSEDEKTVSWPFWSKEAGLKLISFTRDTLIDNNPSPEDIRFIDAELERIKHEILAASRVQNRRTSGKFAKGFRMPADILPAEGPIAYHWLRFRTGQTDHACFTSCDYTGNWTYPLYCDFVRHSEPRPNKPLNLHELLELAEKPAQIVTMAELGITLEKAT